MADQKITQLNQLLAADAQATVDVLPVADVSTAETKKITLADVVTSGVGSISDGTIPGAKLVADSVTATQIAAGAIGSSELGVASVLTTRISDGAVTAAKIAANTITANEVADNAITSNELADSAVDTAAIVDAAVTTAKIADDAVTNAKIGAAAVGTTELADAAVTTAKYAVGSVDTSALEDAAVTTAKLDDLAVTTAKIAADAVGSSQIAADAVTATQIADNAVGAAQISAGAVGTSELADNAVTTAKITDSNVTTAKIADDAVTSAKLGAGAVDTTALSSAAVTNAKIADGTIAAAKLANDLDGSEFLPQSANVVLAGPASGASAVPTFRALTATDIPLLGNANLPVATGSVRGTVIVGTGLSADGSGTLSISNTVVGATATKVTFNSNGLITAGSNLVAADIPSLDASKITTGTFGSALIASDAVTGAKLADSSTTKFGGSVDTGGIVTFPTADFKGQYFYDEINQDLYIWSGSAWLPVTIISGELIFAGTYDASVNQIGTVTAAGAAVGLSVGALLPNASSTNNRYYLVVSDSGTGTGNAPNEALAPPDMILSNGVNWELIDVSSGIGGQIATNVSFSPYGNLLATNVQLAIQELEDEKLAKAGGTVTGEVIFGTTASLVFEGSTADDYETTLAVTDPTADRTITLPDQTGTVLVSGNASIVNADISASAEIAVSKLANGTARQLLQTASGGTDVEWASNIDIPGTLDVTSTATFDSTVAIGAGNLNYSDGTY